MGAVYDFAAQFLARGISIFPVRFRDKKPAVPTWEIYQNITPSQNDLKAWFPVDFRNYGIVLGWQSLAVLDFDQMDAFYQWQMWAVDNAKILDNAFMVKTARGMHVYFALLEQLSNMKMPGIDFKTHGYTVGPQSTHPGGFVYRVLNDLYFPVVERLSEILPDETLSQASIYNDDYQVNDSYARPPELGGVSLLDELDRPANLSPMELAKARYRMEDFFPKSKVDRNGFMQVLCPFHDDKNPSAWVSIPNQLFSCRSCNMRPMSVIGFYAALGKMSISDAVREMSK